MTMTHAIVRPYQRTCLVDLAQAGRAYRTRGRENKRTRAADMLS